MRSFLLCELLRFVATIAGLWLLLFVLLELLPGVESNAAALQPLGERLAVTLPLVLLAAFVALLIGGAITVLAVRMGGWGDRLLRGLAAALGTLPPFWLGLLLVLLLSSLLQLLPAGGFVPWQTNPVGALASLVLPALALGLPHAGQLALRLRTGFDPPPTEAEIRPLRTAGLTSRQARWKYGLARALPQLPQLVAPIVVALLVGTVIVENVFYLPGLGRQVLGAALAHDLPQLRASLFLLLALVAGLILVTALTLLVLDPKLRARQ